MLVSLLPQLQDVRWILDAAPLSHLFVNLAGGGLVRLMPALRRPKVFWLVSVVFSVVAFGQAVSGYLLIVLAAYGLIAGMAWGCRRSRSQRKSRWFWAVLAMLALSGVFLAGRQFAWEGQGAEVMGHRLVWYSLNMWGFLRLLTLLWEFGAGRIERPGMRSYLAWCCLPFTLVGPLLRYSDFAQQIGKEDVAESREAPGASVWARDLLVGVGQVLLGLSLSGLQLYLGNDLVWWGRAALWFGIAPWSFYLIWCGYFRVMECMARCWGLRLSSSFRLPFGRRNISEFWANWNMTATAVFRDYCFYNRWGMKRASVYLNTIILFTLVGLWHGASGYWVIWGLLHGVGFSLFLWYKANRQRFTEWHRPALAKPIRFVSAMATYIFVCSCWVLPPHVLKLIVR
ncbi:MAG: MBOAT family O-acyltransferase [Acidobacteriota bacterium]